MWQVLHENRPFLFRDPPEHSKLRALVGHTFMPMAAKFGRQIKAIANELIDLACEREEVDLVTEFAQPFAVRVIGELFGIPDVDWTELAKWSADLSRGLDPEFLHPPDVQRDRIIATLSFAQYLIPLIIERQAHPGDDLLSALTLVTHRGESLKIPEIVSSAALLLAAGHETTANLISGSIFALAAHSGERAYWCEHGPLGSQAVEELIRFVAPVHLIGRVLVDDVELPSGELEGGSQVIAAIGAGNRDPAVFTEPERLNLGRAPNRHLGFGFGLHHCLGAALARLEASIALDTFLRRIRSFELIQPCPKYRNTVVIRGLARLPVRIDSA